MRFTIESRGVETQRKPISMCHFGLLVSTPLSYVPQALSNRIRQSSFWDHMQGFFFQTPTRHKVKIEAKSYKISGWLPINYYMHKHYSYHYIRYPFPIYGNGASSLSPVSSSLIRHASMGQHEPTQHLIGGCMQRRDAIFLGPSSRANECVVIHV